MGKRLVRKPFLKHKKTGVGTPQLTVHTDIPKPDGNSGKHLANLTAHQPRGNKVLSKAIWCRRGFPPFQDTFTLS